jgi:hypothetical protein
MKIKTDWVHTHTQKNYILNQLSIKEDPQNEYLILMMIRFHFSGGK